MTGQHQVPRLVPIRFAHPLWLPVKRQTLLEAELIERSGECAVAKIDRLAVVDDHLPNADHTRITLHLECVHVASQHLARLTEVGGVGDVDVRIQNA